MIGKPISSNDSKLITDQAGRTFKTLRISLNDTCNLACTYCVGEEETGFPAKVKASQRLDLHQYKQIVQSILEHCAIDTVRLTGGEPLLFKEIAVLVEILKDLGIPKVKMTTNGVFLSRYAENLWKAGLDSINVSLDALDERIFMKLTRRDNLREIIAGIDQALHFKIPVKINCVVLKGQNEDQILPLLEFASGRGMIIRYLELMKMGPLYKQHTQSLFSEKEILDVIGSKYTCIPLDRSAGATARYWITEDLRTFGIIANDSSPFCHDCNRLRLDSRGNIFGCLSNPNGTSILDSLNDPLAMRQRLAASLAQKKTVFTGSSLSMKAIGG